MIPDEMRTILSSALEVMGGTLCFKGTFVLAAIFPDYLSAGDLAERFLEGFGGVGRKQTMAVLGVVTRHAREQIGLEVA